MGFCPVICTFWAWSGGKLKQRVVNLPWIPTQFALGFIAASALTQFQANVIQAFADSIPLRVQISLGYFNGKFTFWRINLWAAITGFKGF